MRQVFIISLITLVLLSWRGEITAEAKKSSALKAMLKTEAATKKPSKALVTIEKMAPYFKLGHLFVRLMFHATTDAAVDIKSFNADCDAMVAALKKEYVLAQLKQEFSLLILAFEEHDLKSTRGLLGSSVIVGKFYQRCYGYVKVMRGDLQSDFFSLGIQATNLHAMLGMKELGPGKEALMGFLQVCERISKAWPDFATSVKLTGVTDLIVGGKVKSIEELRAAVKKFTQHILGKASK